jgi:hypothetical protein
MIHAYRADEEEEGKSQSILSHLFYNNYNTFFRKSQISFSLFLATRINPTYEPEGDVP